MPNVVWESRKHQAFEKVTSWTDDVSTKVMPHQEADSTSDHRHGESELSRIDFVGHKLYEATEKNHGEERESETSQGHRERNSG